MVIGINKDPGGTISSYLKKYIDILSYNKIDLYLLDLSEPDFWEKVKDLDYFIHRWQTTDNHSQRTTAFLPVIETYLNIKCFPNLNTCWHYDDKIKHYYLLKQLNYPVISSWVFWEKDKAIEWIKTADFPLVFKTRKGASSNGVRLIRNKNEAFFIINKLFGKGLKVSKDNLLLHLSNVIKKFINKPIRLPNYWQIEKNYVFFQKFLPDNKWDTRVYTIGQRAFAARRFIRYNDFRASGSGQASMSKDEIDIRFVKIALEISKKLEFQTMAYDFLYDKNNEPRICEISYSMSDYPVYEMEGYWDFNLNWNSGHFWPQYFHLIDLLDTSDLKMPEIILNN